MMTKIKKWIKINTDIIKGWIGSLDKLTIHDLKAIDSTVMLLLAIILILLW